MNKKYFGNSVLVIWLVFCLWAGGSITMSHGEAMHNVGFPFPAFILLWIMIIFLGRFAIEWVINKLWK